MKYYHLLYIWIRTLTPSQPVESSTYITNLHPPPLCFSVDIVLLNDQTVVPSKEVLDEQQQMKRHYDRLKRTIDVVDNIEYLEQRAHCWHDSVLLLREFHFNCDINKQKILPSALRLIHSQKKLSHCFTLERVTHSY